MCDSKEDMSNVIFTNTREKHYFFLYKSLEKRKNRNKHEKDLDKLKKYINQEVYMPRIDSFNDPFEGIFHYLTLPISDILNNIEYFNMAYNNRKIEYYELTKEEFRSKLESSDCKEYRHKIVSDELRKKMFEHSALCLTSNPSNIPMWSHYANDHCGYCLVFELNFDDMYDKMSKENNFGSKANFYDEYINKIINPKDGENDVFSAYLGEGKEKLRLYLTKIKYVKNIQSMDVKILDKFIKNRSSKDDCSYDEIKYTIMNSLGVKYNQWDYEDEYRIILNFNSLDIGKKNIVLSSVMPFMKISGLIIGYNVEDKRRGDIIKMCSKKSIVTYNTEISQKNYEIIIKK
ncbi:MAG: DUF2971 domain-containing protein [Gammaproteobacteria bacterium]|nr:DUF2971 domain-containing protein [Gammaproteobacteria bacterium]